MTLLWLTILYLAAFGAGILALRAGDLIRVVRPRMGTMMLVILATALGAGLLGNAAMIGAAAGVLPLLVTRIVLLFFSLVGVSQLLCLLRQLPPPVVPRWETFVGAGALLTVSVWLVSWNWIPHLNVDSFAYHYPVAKQWVIEGRLVAVPYEAHSNFYQLWSGWLFWGIALDTDNFLMPRQHALICCITLGGVVALQLRRLGSTLAPWLMATAWLLSQETFEFGLTDYMDLPMGMMYLLAAVIMGEALSTVADRRRLLALAGLFLGIAVGLKIPGMAFSAIAGVALLIVLYRESRGWRNILHDATALTLPAVLLWLPWATKNGIITGNPIYPFGINLFPPHPQHLDAALGFLGFYGYGTEPAAPFLQRHLAHLWLWLRNVEHLDPNATAVAAIVAILLVRVRRVVVDHQSAFAFLLATLLLPAAIYLPFRRFALSAQAVQMLALALALLLLYRQLPPARRRIAQASVLVALCFLAQARYHLFHDQFRRHLQEYGVEHRRGLYLTPRAIREGDLQRRPYADLVPIIEANVPPGRLLVTENLYIVPALDVRLQNNMHLYRKNLLRLTTEEEGHDAEFLLQRLRGWGITHLLTRETFDSNPELVQFAEHSLSPIATSGDLTFYELVAEEHSP